MKFYLDIAGKSKKIRGSTQRWDLSKNHDFWGMRLFLAGVYINTRGIRNQIFYQNFCYSSLLVPILLLVFMWKSAKPACVHTNPNYHQGTPGPPEWAEIIDLMMFSPANKTDSKKHFWKKSCVYSKITKNRKKHDFNAIFHFFAIFE